MSGKVEEFGPCDPFLALGVRKIALLQAIEKRKRVLEVLGLRELLSLGILHARLHEGCERLVVVLVPELLQLEKLPRLCSAEDQRNAVGVDGRARWAPMPRQ
jgi:hypothetical protein